MCAVVAACGSSKAETAGASYISCLPAGMAVTGGQLESLAVHGSTCAVAEQVMTLVIAGQNAGGGDTVTVDGWRCQSYGGNQTTCLHGASGLYGQYSRS
jgi:hypothetical protein